MSPILRASFVLHFAVEHLLPVPWFSKYLVPHTATLITSVSSINCFFFFWLVLLNHFNTIQLYQQTNFKLWSSWLKWILQLAFSVKLQTAGRDNSCKKTFIFILTLFFLNAERLIICSGGKVMRKPHFTV